MRHCSCKIQFAAIVLLFLLHSVKLQAQFDVFRGNPDTSGSYRTLVTKQVDTSGEISKIGPNRLFFASPCCQLGVMPGPQVYGAQTNWWSWSLYYGIRMKLKIFSWNALVWDIGYRYDRYSIRQNTPKLAPLTIENHVREKIVLHNFSFALCDRINFGKRGNVLGNWLDLGVYADDIFHSSNVYLDQHFDSNSPSGRNIKVKTTDVHLPYISTLNYGFTVRAGGEWNSFFIQYRVNSLFTVETPNNRDLPKIIVGFAFAGWE